MIMKKQNCVDERLLNLLIGIVLAKAKQGKKQEAGALLMLAAEMAKAPN
jgi:hypothetical protein